MTAANEVLAAKSFFSSDTVSRVIKTLIEVTAAQAALYTTVIPNAPSVKGSAAVSGGAALLSLVWALLVNWATQTKSAKLDTLAAAIDKAVDARIAAQAQVPSVTSVVLAAPSAAPTVSTAPPTAQA